MSDTETKPMSLNTIVTAIPLSGGVANQRPASAMSRRPEFWTSGAFAFAFALAPPPEQEGAIKELVTSTITTWHASAGADDMTADMVTGLAFWALQFVDWKSIAESIRP